MTAVDRLSDADAACAFAAARIAAALAHSLSERGRAHFSLAGGNTPRRAYQLVAPLLGDWSAVELWYGDERCVQPDDPDSNHRLVAESLLTAIAHAGSEPPLEHRILGELGAEPAARQYEALLRERVPADADEVPALDVSLLGLGEDGHTASLFPGHPEVSVVDALCVAVHDSPKPPPDRVTLTLPVLRAARSTLLLVTGAGKAQALAGVLAGADPSVPASLVGGPRLHVIADEAALPGGPPPRRGCGDPTDGPGAG